MKNNYQQNYEKYYGKCQDGVNYQEDYQGFLLKEVLLTAKRLREKNILVSQLWATRRANDAFYRVHGFRRIHLGD